MFFFVVNVVFAEVYVSLFVADAVFGEIYVSLLVTFCDGAA